MTAKERRLVQALLDELAKVEDLPLEVRDAAIDLEELLARK